MNAQSKDLAARIWSAFPVSQPAFAKLLQLLEIEATAEVPTACVTFGVRSRMLINPAFVQSACRNDAELVMLVLHELHHIVMGHTRLFRRITPAENFAFDAIINAHLSHLFEDWQGASLFRHTYRDDVFPQALLRPPEDWRTGSPQWRMTGRALDIHKALYESTQVSYTDVLALFPLLSVPGLRAGEGGLDTSALEGIPLLGNHEVEASAPGDLAAEIRSIIARWPMVDIRSGRDQGGALRNSLLEVGRPHLAAQRVMRRALVSVARRGVGEFRGDRRWTQVESSSPLRSRTDRRGQWRDGLGETVLMWRNAAEQPSRDRVGRVHLYIDVSGSMREFMPAVYGAAVPLIPYLAPCVHLFSTEVADITYDALRRGVVATTAGTEIAVVTKHMLDHDVRNAVVITDGWVGEVPQEHARLLARRRLRAAAVVTRQGDDDFITALGGAAFRLPDAGQREAA